MRRAAQNGFVSDGVKPIRNEKGQHISDFCLSMDLVPKSLKTFKGEKIDRVTFEDGDISWYTGFTPTVWLDWSEQTMDEKFPD